MTETNIARSPAGAALTELPQPQVANMSPIVQAAMEGKLDTDKLNELLTIQEKYEAMEARKAYHQAVANFKANAPTVKKNKTVCYTTDKGTTEYDHASLGYALAEINPVLSQYGLSLSWRTKQENGGTYVTAVLTHSMGHSEETTLFASPDTSGGKNSIQSIASSVTYLKRHTAFAILGLEAVDADDDGQGFGAIDYDTTITQEQAAELLTMIANAGKTTEAFIAHAKKSRLRINAIEQLPAEKFEWARDVIGASRPAARAYPDDKFEANFASWKRPIIAGRKTPDQVIARIESTYTLSADQKRRIRNIKQGAAA